MSRRIMIAANWKLHMNVSESSHLMHRLHERIRIHRDVEVVIAPTMLSLQPLSLQIDRRKFRLASQDAYHEDAGAFTGEVSYPMLKGIVHYGIVGHSDRRYKFNDSLEDVRDKVSAAVRSEIIPILCVGETQAERLAGETSKVLHDQVTTAIQNLTAGGVTNMVIAYEPVWAISNGHNFRDLEIPTPENIGKAVKTIRKNIASMHGQKVADSVRVLYGGSTHSGTAGGFLDIPGIDGLLVGGASMNYHEFSAIVDKAAARAKGN